MMGRKSHGSPHRQNHIHMHTHTHTLTHTHTNLVVSLYDFKVFWERKRWCEAGCKGGLLCIIVAVEPVQQPLQCHSNDRKAVRLKTIALCVLWCNDGDLWPREVAQTHGVAGSLFEEERRREKVCEVTLTVVDVNSHLRWRRNSIQAIIQMYMYCSCW